MLDPSSLTPQDVLLWVGAWSLIGAVFMGFDKVQAMSHSERISERALHLVALAGGVPGIVVGAAVFHHKTSKPSFWVPIGGAVVVWVVLLVLLARSGVLRLSV